MNNEFEARTVKPNTRMRRANTVGNRGTARYASEDQLQHGELHRQTGEHKGRRQSRPLNS